MSISDQDLARLEQIRKRLAIWSIRMTTAAGSGHPSSCLSASHMVTALYFGGFLRLDPKRPDAPERDRFIMSKGHAAPILYAALAEKGVVETSELLNLRKIGNPLEGHPNLRRVPGVEASTGSLGQGLSIGLGIALAQKLAKNDARTYVLTGDGELDEGQVWEAAMTASKYKADNLIAMVDRNHYQQTGHGDVVLPLEPLAAKWQACGWETYEIDGHDWKQVIGALSRASDSRGRPTAILARTVKGYGVTKIVDDPGNKFHGVPLKAQEAEEAIQEIERA
ncbi:MAG: transketolase [bacterium]